MSETTTLEVLIQIREELAGLKRTREGLQGAKQDAVSLGEVLKQGLGIGTGVQMAAQAIGMLKAGLQSTVGAAFDLAGELKDTSEALDIATDSLQTFRFELQDGGVEMGRLNTAISAQNRSLAEARDAGSGAAQAYRALHLSAGAVERMPTAERILAVVRATATAEDRTLAFSAAAQILGDRDLPKFIAALGRLATEGLPAINAIYDGQGKLLGPKTISDLDQAKKAWEGLGRSIVVTTGNWLTSAKTGLDAVGYGPDLAPLKPRRTNPVPFFDFSPAGVDPGASFGAQTRRRTPGTAAPSFFDSLFARENPGAREAIEAKAAADKAAASEAAADKAAQAAAAKAAADQEEEAAQARRLALNTQLADAQANLTQIQATSATDEANGALTIEEKDAAKRVSLENEITQRQEIIALLGQTQQFDFSDPRAKAAEMAKQEEELLRAKNALATQGNTAAQQQARQLFDLESQALAAEAAGQTKVAEQKREQIKAIQLSTQLEGQAPALVQARIAAERQLTEAQRTRAKGELDFSRSIGQIEQAMALVEADNALTERERQAKLLPLLEQKNKLTADHIALLEQDTRLQQGDQTALELQKTIDDLRSQLADGQAKAASAAGPETLAMRDQKGMRDMSDPSQHYQSAGEGAQGGLMGWYTQVGTMADQLATGISSNLQNAVNSVSSGIAGWLNGTQTWGQMISNIRQQIGTQLISTIIQMGTQWLVQQALVRTGMIATTTLGASLKAAETGTTIAAEATKTPILATNAALASVSSFGIASILGIALLVAGIAALAFKSGGVVPGGEQLIRVNEDGTESVLNARATSMLGADAIAMLNAGADLQDLLAADVTGGIAAPVMAMQSAGPAAAPAAATSTEASPINLVVGIHGREKDARSWMESQAGQKVMINQMKRAGFVHR